MKIFVANLPYHINNDAIRQLFGLFGAVISAKIITQNGKSKGFGFLEMENDQQAEQAIRHLDGSPLDDRNMIVRHADDQSPSQSSPQKIHKRPRLSFTKI
jgi:RNA recognition motif-containing protein